MPIQLLLYAGAAIIILGMLGTAGYKIRESGKDEVRVEWQAANAAAQKKADDDRARQDALRQAQDAEATRRLANEKKRSQTLMASLEAHIKASGTAAACPMPPLLLDDWNRANAGSQGDSPGAVPSGSMYLT